MKQDARILIVGAGPVGFLAVARKLGNTSAILAPPTDGLA